MIPFAARRLRLPRMQLQDGEMRRCGRRGKAKGETAKVRVRVGKRSLRRPAKRVLPKLRAGARATLTAGGAKASKQHKVTLTR
jgi:hypothetical protein